MYIFPFHKASFMEHVPTLGAMVLTTHGTFVHADRAFERYERVQFGRLRSSCSVGSARSLRGVMSSTSPGWTETQALTHLPGRYHQGTANGYDERSLRGRHLLKIGTCHQITIFGSSGVLIPYGVTFLK